MAVRKLKKAPDTDPSFFDQTGGILMIFVIAILLGLLCLVLRKIYKHVNWSQLMGCSSNGNKQRIENSSDCPISLDSRLKSAVSFEDGSARGDKNCYYG